MSNIIGAESARWAGLQIDLHSKYRAGNLTADQLEWFLNLSGERRVVLVTSEPTDKFAPLVDLGIITVPDDYNHTTWLDSFRARYQNDKTKLFYYYHDAITDENFPNPSRVLKPGDRFCVRVFKQIVPGTTTSEERKAFLAREKAVFTGAHGAALVW